jgi:tetratricopeptide (TPR) repeat protein
MGKSTLLRRFERIARGLADEDRANAARYQVASRDWQVGTEVAARPLWWVLGRIHEDVELACGGRSQRAFARFREVMTRVPELFAQAQALGLVDSGPAQPSAGYGPDALKAIGSAVGAGASALGVPVPADTVAQVVNTAATAARRAQRRPGPDPKVFRELVDQTAALVEAFAQGMRAISRRHPVVVLLDTCELLGDALALSEQSLIDVIRKSGSRTVWVLAMRLEDSEDASAESTATAIHRRVDEERMRSIDLKGFNDRGVESYLRRRLGESRLTAAETDQVASLTRGIPLALSVAADAIGREQFSVAEILAQIGPDGEISEVIRVLAGRYLVHTAKVPDLVPDRHRLCTLAMARNAMPGPGLLAALWDIEPDQVARAMDELIAHHDFMLGRRRIVHPEVRDVIRIFMLTPQERVGLHGANTRAVAYLVDRLQRYQHADIEAQLVDDEWCADILDLLWHTFWRDQRAGIDLTLHLMPVARIAEPLGSGVAAITKFFAPVCGTADRALLADLGFLAAAHFHVGGTVAPEPSSRTLDRIANAAPPASPILAPQPAMRAYRLLLAAEHQRPVGNALERAADMLREAAAQIRPGDGRSAMALALTARTIPPWDIAGLPPTEQEAALTLWRIACAYQPADAGTHFDLGVAVHRLRRFEEAVDNYRRAIDVSSPQTAPYSNLGLAYLDLARYEDALRAQQTAVRLAPSTAVHHGNLAECLWMVYGDVPQAERELREALDLNPDSADHWAYLARVLLAQGKDDEARAALDKAAERPRETSPWLPLLQAAASLDTPAGSAARYFRTALERTSEPKPRFLAMSGFGWAECGALALAGLGRADEARELLSAHLGTRCGADLFQRTVYERLAAVMPPGAMEGILEVWQAIVTEDPMAAGPFGFAGPTGRGGAERERSASTP